MAGLTDKLRLQNIDVACCTCESFIFQVNRLLSDLHSVLSRSYFVLLVVSSLLQIEPMESLFITVYIHRLVQHVPELVIVSTDATLLHSTNST